MLSKKIIKKIKSKWHPDTVKEYIQAEYENSLQEDERPIIRLKLDTNKNIGIFEVIDVKKIMKEYEVSLWPNNQNPILLGYYKGTNKKSVLERVCKENGIKIDDDCLCVIENSNNTPIKRWRKI